MTQKWRAGISRSATDFRRQLAPTWRRVALLVLAFLVPTSVDAQVPSGPFTLADGRLVVSGEVSASTSTDDDGFFNYTSYEHNNLRRALAAIELAFRVSDRVFLMADVRTATDEAFSAYAWYARVRPWTNLPIDIQIGRIPPTFGTFSRRSYAFDNPLIGWPLAYQYLTSLRHDAAAGSADDLRRMRGRGWLSAFPVGSNQPGPGLPMIAGLEWDTGASLRVGDRRIEGSVAMTTGTLSNPGRADGNDGWQTSGRVRLSPVVGLTLGVSGAQGEYLARDLVSALPPEVRGATYRQRSVGLDAEYSRDYWLVRSEVIRTSWEVPALVAPIVQGPLGVLSVDVEGRYKILPGLYAAVRLDHLAFSDVTNAAGPFTWDANVRRVEAGVGYSIWRNLLAKVTYQHNWRDGGRTTRERIVATQLLYWF